MVSEPESIVIFGVGASVYHVGDGAIVYLVGASVYLVGASSVYLSLVIIGIGIGIGYRAQSCLHSPHLKIS